MILTITLLPKSLNRVAYSDPIVLALTTHRDIATLGGGHRFAYCFSKLFVKVGEHVHCRMSDTHIVTT